MNYSKIISGGLNITRPQNYPSQNVNFRANYKIFQSEPKTKFHKCSLMSIGMQRVLYSHQMVWVGSSVTEHSRTLEKLANVIFEKSSESHTGYFFD